LNFSGCQSCHTDPHHGAFQEVKFRGACDTCHNTNGFKKNQPGTDFHHYTTKFPLLGKHTSVACSKCHQGADFHRPIAHERCRDCHEDPHKGQFATRAAGSDCGSCHEVTGFKPTRFDRETHRQSAFPLEGKHAALRCPECHKPEGRDAVEIGEAVAALPLGNVIDFVKERARLEKELKKAHDEIARFEAKLGNEQFVSRAPEDVLQEQRDKLAEAQALAARLKEAVARLSV